jgi:hypothetical protein
MLRQLLKVRAYVGLEEFLQLQTGPKELQSERQYEFISQDQSFE